MDIGFIKDYEVQSDSDTLILHTNENKTIGIKLSELLNKKLLKSKFTSFEDHKLIQINEIGSFEYWDY